MPCEWGDTNIYTEDFICGSCKNTFKLSPDVVVFLKENNQFICSKCKLKKIMDNTIYNEIIKK